MERRVLLAIFLSFLVLYVYRALVVTPVPKPAAGAPAAAPIAAGGRGTPSQPEAVTNPPAATAAPLPIAAAAPAIGEGRERDIRVENRDVIAVFTTRGARLKSLRLKHYLDQARQPQELVEKEIESLPLPFTLQTANEQTTRVINGAVYEVSGEPAAGASGPVRSSNSTSMHRDTSSRSAPPSPAAAATRRRRSIGDRRSATPAK
ncbi:MAG: hypothetical protein DMG03_23160 [Acidobacteria bacterium]|nr:MAG: hypothetical protein DMG03_23160 [Acidobacteriota bacterium]